MVKRNRNKEKQAVSAKKHYLKHIDKIKARAIAYKTEARNRNREYVTKFLKEHPCVDCGECDIVVLDFDHVKGVKKDNISGLVWKAVKIERLKDEMDKCEIRCANCHRRKTYRQRVGGVVALRPS